MKKYEKMDFPSILMMMNWNKRFKVAFFDGEAALYHTSYLNTIRYKGRDSALEIGRKLSIIRPGATTVVAP